MTTEPAATIEFSPTVTPPMIIAPAAIQTFLSIAMGFAVTPARDAGQGTGFLCLFFMPLLWIPGVIGWLIGRGIAWMLHL